MAHVKHILDTRNAFRMGLIYDYQVLNSFPKCGLDYDIFCFDKMIMIFLIYDFLFFFQDELV